MAEAIAALMPLLKMLDCREKWPRIIRMHHRATAVIITIEMRPLMWTSLIPIL
jgi:hypothetical protein